jgi:DNA-binding CsgD family transcriptional regulator
MAPAACAGAWLSLMLDEVDYGMVLLDVRAQVLHANQAARTEFESEHPLQLLAGGGLRARQGHHELRLRDALAGARGGRRTLLSLDDAGRPLSVAVIPLDGHGEVGATLLLMGKRRTCTMPTLQGFADCHGLTAAETRVLAGLCAGTHPREVARQHGVSLVTVRSQISSMRAKTGAGSIRALVQQVWVLPPLAGGSRATG